jgi:NAD(P)H-dependent FMN reductase
MANPKILVFAGATRSASFNKKLARLAADAARAAGGEVTLVDLRDYAMPLYDGDLEDAEGLPEAGKRFKNLMREHAGFIIAAPEYNSSITGVLKNTIDWASREETDDEPPLVAYRGKVALLLSASPGALGGLRGLVHLRAILGNIGVIVLPDQLAIGTAHEAFDQDGQLKDPMKGKRVKDLAAGLVAFLKKHAA